MKKVALSLIALLAAGSFAFAEDSAAGTTIPAPLAATLSANGWAQFGTDLDTGSLGFKNGTEAKITLDILNGTNTKGDQGGVITVADIKLRLDGNVGGAPVQGKGDDGILNTDDDTIDSKGALYLTIGDITAKIVVGDLYVKLTLNTDPSASYSVDGDDDNGGASIVADDAFYTYKNTYGADKDEWQVGGITGYDSFDGTGIEAGYTIPGVVKLVGDVASAGAWSSTDKDGQDFEGSLAASLLAVDKLTLTLKGYYGSLGSERVQALGGELAYDLGVVAPFAHFNATADTEKDKNWGEWSADFGAKLPIVDGLKAVAVGKYDSASKVDFALTADLAKAKLAGPLGAQFGIWLRDATSDVKANKKTDLFVKVEADVADGFNVWGKTSFNNTGADKSDSLFLKAGVTASKLLPMTEFSATWESNDMGGAKAQGDNTKGQLYVQAKVTY